MYKTKRQYLKKEIREKLLKIRRRQFPKERKRKSLLIWKKLKALQKFRVAKTVMFYLSLPEEVDTEMMVKETIRMGKEVIVPVVQLRKKKMTLSVLKDYDRELGIGSFKIPEPKNRYIRKISADVIDLVIVPGVAFDEKCGRLGFGKGFYDCFFKNLPTGVASIGLAYDFQVLARLPMEEHDVSLNKIVTEKRVIDCKEVTKC